MKIRIDKKKLLLAGGSHSDIPLILAAKRLGFYVISVSNRPEDMGHQYSDEVYLDDYSDLSAMLEIAMKYRIDAICPCCNDFSAISSAYVAERMGLNGHDPYDISRMIHRKDMFRDLLIKNNIPSPYAASFCDLNLAYESLKKFRLPVIVKPVDRTGGKGVSKIEKFEEAKPLLKTAFDASRAKKIIIEEFIEGSRHGFSTFILNKKVAFYFSDNEYYYKNQYLVSAASAPSTISSEVEDKLKFYIEKIASLLDLRDGIFHLQFILKDNEPFITDVCRRGPGDLYIRLVELATGIDYSTYIVKAFAGMDCSDISQKKTSGYFTRHCIMGDKNGILKKVVYDESIKSNIREEFVWWKPGIIINDYLTQKFGIIFLEFSSLQEMLEKTAKMQELIKTVIE